MTRIYLSPPHIGRRERELLAETLDSNWIAPLGPQVDAFERELAERCGVEAAAASSSGTAALHLALRLAGVGSGDVVVCPTLTFVASVSPVVYLGAEPVFVDVSSESWTLDPDLLDGELGRLRESDRAVRAVVAVDLYGQCCDYEAIEEICSRHEVTLIEDAAEAVGSSYRERPAGGFGAFGVLSFNGNKIITTSGGGALVSDDVAAIEKARFLASQARDPAPHYEHSEIGYNYRLSNLLAALGRAQLESLDEKVAARRRNFAHYRALLGDLPGVSFMPEPEGTSGNRWLTVLTVDPGPAGTDREAIRLALEAEDIEARPVWKPMHLQPLFRGRRCVGGSVAERLFDQGLCLPSGSALEERDLERVASIVRSVIRSS